MLVVGFTSRVRDCTVTGMLQGAGLAGEWHHSRAHDFFARAKWQPDDVGLRLLDLLVHGLLKPGAPIRLALDDTVGNVPLAAVLWSGGISFAGVMAFIFADLIVLPILAIYRKYYGTRFALRITALMFVTMVAAALAIDGLFSGLGIIPHGARPTRADIFSSIHVDYKLALNVLGLVIFAGLFWVTVRRGATDPICGMKVDRAKAVQKSLADETFYFCTERCLHAFEADPAHQDPGIGRAPETLHVC